MDVHCMAESFIAVVSNQGEEELYSWGWNEHGNLGLGDKVDRAELTKVPFDTAQHTIR